MGRMSIFAWEDLVGIDIKKGPIPLSLLNSQWIHTGIEIDNTVDVLLYIFEGLKDW